MTELAVNSDHSLGNDAGHGAVASRNQPAAFEEALSVFGISIETGLGASRRFTI
jgi:hypothetical protein